MAKKWYNHDIIDDVRSKKQLGSVFEDDFIQIVQSQFKNIEDVRGTELDKKQGTDFIYNKEIRIDVTLNFSEKDTMPFIFETKTFLIRDQELPVKIGIRHGNTHSGYTEFEIPVVVIGIDIDTETYLTWQDPILENIDKKIDEIMINAIDAWLDYTTTDEEERKHLFEQPLQVNRNYKCPKSIGPSIKRLNEQQKQIMDQKGL